MTGGLLALHDHPEQWAKLRANPALVDSLVPEIIRWQTPLALHAAHRAGRHRTRRQADQERRQGGDVVPVGQPRRRARSTTPDRFIIDRTRPRQHLSFGFGIHRCVGNRLAELQLRILWEEILKRFPVIEVVGEPVRVRSTFVRGFSQLPVRIPG